MVHNGLLCITGVTQRVHGAITNKQYQENSTVSASVALRELNDLCSKGIFLKRGKTGLNTRGILQGIVILPGIPEVIPGAIRAPIGVWYTQTGSISSPVYESPRINRILPIGRFYSTPKDG
jgi:hypothetical protein